MGSQKKFFYGEESRNFYKKILKKEGHKSQL